MEMEHFSAVDFFVPCINRFHRQFTHWLHRMLIVAQQIQWLVQSPGMVLRCRHLLRSPGSGTDVGPVQSADTVYRVNHMIQ